jgi:hypothetical protein
MSTKKSNDNGFDGLVAIQLAIINKDIVEERPNVPL